MQEIDKPNSDINLENKEDLLDIPSDSNKKNIRAFQTSIEMMFSQAMTSRSPNIIESFSKLSNEQMGGAVEILTRADDNETKVKLVDSAAKGTESKRNHVTKITSIISSSVAYIAISILVLIIKPDIFKDWLTYSISLISVGFGGYGVALKEFNKKNEEKQTK